MKELIEGVNVFIEEVEPEDPIGPMICNSSIQLKENELRFLTRGPKFMMRNEIDIKEFTVDVEKMIVKESYNGEENKGMNDNGVYWDAHHPQLGRCAQVIGDSINI